MRRVVRDDGVVTRLLVLGALLLILYAFVLMSDRLKGWLTLLVMSGMLIFECWRRWRRRTPGLCPKCRYDMTGLPESAEGERRCPECGTMVRG